MKWKAEVGNGLRPMTDRGSGNSEHANQENILKIGATSQTVVLEMLKSGNAQKLKLGRPAADGELLIADGGGKTAARLMADVG